MKIFTPLSALQITELCTLAGQAFKAAKLRGGVDDETTLEAYRKQGQIECGVISLKQATQAHYLELKGKWFTVIGNLEQAFYCFLNAGPQLEAARQMKFRLMGQVSRLATAIKKHHFKENQIELTATECARQAWAYAQTLSLDKYAGAKIDSLNAQQLEQLGFTVLNRANAKEGKGSTASRNKKQRDKVPTPAEVIPDRPPLMSRRRQTLAAQTARH